MNEAIPDVPSLCHNNLLLGFGVGCIGKEECIENDICKEDNINEIVKDEAIVPAGKTISLITQCAGTDPQNPTKSIQKSLFVTPRMQRERGKASIPYGYYEQEVECADNNSP
jgi:hypothetical protein